MRIAHSHQTQPMVDVRLNLELPSPGRRGGLLFVTAVLAGRTAELCRQARAAGKHLKLNTGNTVFGAEVLLVVYR